MGIRGLTTFIDQREHLYYDSIILEDCAVIIDGNCLIPHLYNSSLIRTSPYGGDYDKIGALTETFFKRLAFNNVFPIVVFDGGVEQRKISTVKGRAKCKLMSLQRVTPHNSNSQCFPLLMRKAMREKLIDMGVVILQSDLEADGEIAALSKIYQIPVMSNDSDFFIFNVLYIPIPKLYHGAGTNSKIECKLFRGDKFLRHVDLDIKRLPLLAVVLGNDYIPRAEFQQFLGQVKMENLRNQAQSQQVVVGVLRWLKAESLQTALQKILCCMRLRARKMLKQKMIKIMRGYTNLTTVLTEYMPEPSKVKRFDFGCLDSLDNAMCKLTVDHENHSDVDSDIDVSPDAEGGGNGTSSSDGINYCSSDGSEIQLPPVDDVEVEAIIKAEKTNSCSLPPEIFPKWLMDKSRMGLIAPDILTILNLKTFFSTPQPECYDKTYSGEPYFHILQCIGGILLGPGQIHCWYRQHKNKYEETALPTITGIDSKEFPKLEDMEKLTTTERRELLLEILRANVEGNLLSDVPENWKLYIICICCWIQNDVNHEVKPHHINSVIMMMLTILVIDKKIGFNRQRKSFIKRYGVTVGRLSKTRKMIRNSSYPTYGSISEGFEKVAREDCILAFDSLLQNFHVDRRMQYSKQSASSIVHPFARFQQCLKFTSMLNNVLASPYPDIKIHAFFNGTFLYNTAMGFKQKPNVTASIESFLATVPTLLGMYKVMWSTIMEMCPTMVYVKPKKKSRKPKPAPVMKMHKETTPFDSDSEPFYDINNRFCAKLI